MVSQSQEPSRNLSHLEILVLSKKKIFMCPILEDDNII